MRSLFAGGVALALASGALLSEVNAQYAPYGAPTSYGAPATYGAPTSYGTPAPYGAPATYGAPRGPAYFQPGESLTIAPASGYGPAAGRLVPTPAYGAPLEREPGVLNAPGALNAPTLGGGLRSNAPAWPTDTRMLGDPAGPLPAPATPLYGPPPVAGESPYADPQWQASPWSDQSAGRACDLPACCAAGSNWYGGVYGLLMTRDNENDVWLSYDTNDIQNRVLTTRDADMEWAGGFETRIGRYFNCGNNAIEAVYWGVFPNVRAANAYPSDVAGDLDTVLHFDDVWYDDGGVDPPVSDAYFAAQRHLLLRSYQFHNVELNLLGGTCQAASCGPRFSWLAGARYFRFDEGLKYATDPSDMGLSGDPNEVTYTVNVINNLVGMQVGGQVDYDLSNCFNVYAGAKVGLFGNHMRHRSKIGTDYVDAYINDPGGPFDASILCVRGNKDDVAMLGEINLGGVYHVTPCWSVNAGYRAVGISGLALATNQIPVDYIANLDSLRAIDSNGSMILHGFYGGVQYNW